MREPMSPMYIVLWTVCIGILAGLFIAGVAPVTWATAFVVLFLLPELVGLSSSTDTLPPLTHVVRLWVPRWVTYTLTFGLGAWMIGAWWERAVHPLIMAVLVAGMVGWLVEHWRAAYDEWAEVLVEDEIHLWRVQ